MISSGSVRSEGEMVPRLRPLMSVDLFHAAINGNMLMPGVAEEHPSPASVTIEIEPYQTQQDELQHVTRSGDTLLHVLVTNKHDNLAWSVFESHPSLLKAQNMMLETPLHSAAKVGNNDFISRLITSHPLTVKEVLRKMNKEGDTAMHVAAKHGCKDVGHMLMICDGEVAYDVNNKMLSPLNIAIIQENLEMVKIMIEDDHTLASTQFSNGLFPVHLAAHMGQTEMVKHFINNYPRAAKLLDPRGRNLLHIAAEEGQNDIFRVLLEISDVRRILETQNEGKDYEGNSLLHVAAMKGHLSLMKHIWEKYKCQGDKVNTHGLTPIDLFLRQLRATTKVDDSLARSTIDQKTLNHKWFKKAMQPSLEENQWDRTQVIGLGSVLITTVTFAATYTVPGGYNQNDGTPLLGRKYTFRAFILANTVAFIYGFLSLYILLKGAAEGRPGIGHLFAIDTFLLAACSMLVAFGLGLYVTLNSVCRPLAIIVLSSTIIICFLNNFNVRVGNRRNGLLLYVATFLVIFVLAIV